MNKLELMFSEKQTSLVSSNIIERFKKVISNGHFIMGNEVTELENMLAKRINYKHGIACANGTDALTLALMAFNLKADEVVFTPSFTFIATAEAISVLGGIPYFVDVESGSFNICPDNLEKSILNAKQKGLQIRGIISVDLFGHKANYQGISDLAKKYDLFFISDAAQSFGATDDSNIKADILTTSFFPTKPLGCYGDGGMLFTDSDDLSEKLNSLTMHGKGTDKYHNVRVGMNSRLDTLQAAVLLEKFIHFEKEIESRNTLAAFYSKHLSNIVRTPTTVVNAKPTWAVYTLLHKERDTIIKKLKSVGIPSNIYYHTPLHLQTAYKHYPKSENLKNSENYSQSCFCLPMHAYISEEQREFIVNELKNILKDLDENN